MCGFAGGEEGLDGLAATRLRTDLSRFFPFLLVGLVFAILGPRGYFEVLILGDDALVLNLTKFVTAAEYFFGWR